jgi:anthranilate phosphoribosyltransferase
MLDEAIQRVEAGRNLAMDEMAELIGQIMDGHAPPPQVAALLGALHRKGETVDEVAGAALAMRQHMTPIRHRHARLIDTCGTGGDGSRTFNISTAAALVTAAAGVPVAKHGNRGITSRSGSADVLAALGVNVEADVACVESCLDELGICFCFAPVLHRAMRHVAPIRKQLPHPTIFNILGPLANPARAPFQLLGVGRESLRPLMAESLRLLGVQRAVVVHGADGLDEVTLAADTLVSEAIDGATHQRRWMPADFGLESSGLETMLVDGPEASAAIIRRVFDGERGPARDIVVANAAAALWTAGHRETLRQCAAAAGEAIDGGLALGLLHELATRTTG